MRTWCEILQSIDDNDDDDEFNNNNNNDISWSAYLWYYHQLIYGEESHVRTFGVHPANMSPALCNKNNSSV